MKEQKKYFKSPYLKGNEDFLHKEFSDKLPVDHFLADQKKIITEQVEGIS